MIIPLDLETLMKVIPRRRFVGMHSFGASGKIADVYKKFDINAEAVVRAAHETLAEVAAL